MKKILFFVCLSFCIKAQKPENWTKADWDFAIAQKGAKLFLQANKDLLEANETAVLSLRIVIPPKAGPDGIPDGMPTDAPMPDSEVSPYKVTNWRVIEGGGNIITDGLIATYTAPKQAPARRIMVISVDCEPLSPNFPKLQLLKTLYFSENETAITLNIPPIGIVNAKFVNKIAGGVKIPANANVSADIQAKMAEAQQKLAAAQQSSGYNMNALMSNAMAIYDPAQNLTVLRFSELALQAMDGSLQIVPNMGMLTIAYKGKGTGTFSLKDKEVGLIFFLTVQQKGCGCSKDARDNNDDEMRCTGSVIVTQDDGKEIKGSFATRVFSDDGKNIVIGNIYGKFRAVKAN